MDHHQMMTWTCDVVELFTGSTGLSRHMSRLNMKVGEPIDYKHGWSFNSKTKRNQVLKQLEKIEPKFVLINNPSPNAWNQSIYKYCLDLMRWQLENNQGFLVVCPPGSGFADFLKRYKLDSRK